MSARESRKRKRETAKLACGRDGCEFFSGEGGFCSVCTIDFKSRPKGQKLKEFRKTTPSLPTTLNMGKDRMDPWIAEHRVPLPPQFLQNITRIASNPLSSPPAIYAAIRGFLAGKNFDAYPTFKDFEPILQHIPEYPAVNKMAWEYALFSWTIDYYNIPRTMGSTQCYFGNFGESPSTPAELFRKMQTNICFANQQVPLVSVPSGRLCL